MEALFEKKKGDLEVYFYPNHILQKKVTLFGKEKLKEIEYRHIQSIDYNKTFKTIVINESFTKFITFNIENIEEERELMDFLKSKTNLEIQGLPEKEVNRTGESKDLTCPKCGSTQFMAGTQRLSGKRAIVGGLLSGPLGAAIGGITSKRVVITCLNCGHSWKAGNRK